MKRKKVFITRSIPEKALKLLDEFDLNINKEDRALSHEEIKTGVKDADAVLCLLNDVIDDDILAVSKGNCRIFANYAVGYNNIDITSATKRGIIITNTPDVLDDATADLAASLLFSVSRHVLAADSYMRSGNFKGWSPMLFLGRDISRKTLGIVGAGRIGSNFAKKMSAFNMKILYTSNTPKPEFEKLTGASFVTLDELLRESDFVSLHVPLLQSTKHLIGERELSLMKETSVLINTSRGPVVDEKALISALKSGKIWGAGLDVYENEPLMESGLETLSNVVLLPHIASATEETRTNMGIIACENIKKVLNGQLPDTCVNPEVLRKEGKIL